MAIVLQSVYPCCLLMVRRHRVVLAAYSVTPPLAMLLPTHIKKCLDTKRSYPLLPTLPTVHYSSTFFKNSFTLAS